MQRRGAVSAQGFQVIGSAVTLILRQPILGIELVELLHPVVSLNLC